jgi:CDP-diacylglycerol--glycerol-3-phosphate 3-phosphatidyltransferase
MARRYLIPSRIDLTVPNFLTLGRMIMAVLAAYLFWKDRHVETATSLCVLATLLDVFDGWYARRFHQVTKLGEHLDPFADKVLITVIFVATGSRLGIWWFWAILGLILCREVIITLYRAYQRRKWNTFVPASLLGKSKMILQSVVGNFLLLGVTVFPRSLRVPDLTILLSLLSIFILSVVSGLNYVRRYNNLASLERLRRAQEQRRKLREARRAWARGGEIAH